MEVISNEGPLDLNEKYNELSVPSNRILYHVPCKVCRDHSSGKHYGIYACDGCAGFFKRSIRRSRQYECKSQKQGPCVVDKTHRNQCRACRLRKCIEVGMNKDTVQNERGPRNSTLRRHMGLYKDAILGGGEMSSMRSELLLNTAGLGFPGMALHPPPTITHPRHQYPTLGGVFQPLYMDVSPAHMSHGSPLHQAHSGFFTPMNALAGRVLPPTPPLLAVENIKETAAEHLFKNVNWIKSVRAFTELPMPDQLQLLEESWKEFFILAMAQYLIPINFAQLLFVYESENLNREVTNMVTREVHSFQDVLNQLCYLKIDNNEYECLRAITLFRKPSSNAWENMCTGDDSPNSSCSGEQRGVIASGKILSLHEEARAALHSYITHSHPLQPLRFHNMLGVLPLMNKVSSFTIEELFFRKTIGDITIVRLISDMYSQRKI